MSDWKQNLVEKLKEDEALMLFAYPDPLSPMGKRLGRSGIASCGTTGYLPAGEKKHLSDGHPWTIGYGTVRPWVKHGVQIREKEAEALLLDGVNIACKEAEALVGEAWHNLTGVRKEVLANMSYNLGYTRLSDFKRMLKAVKEFNFKDAALEMRNSRWAVQVKGRADRLIKQMLTGKRE